jgi:hypothetical protein
MSKNSMAPLVATLLIAAFVHDTAFAQAADHQPHQLVGRLAKIQRTVRVQPKNILSHNAVSRHRVTQISSYCRFEHGEKDPDPRVRLQLARDCRFYEDDTSD